MKFYIDLDNSTHTTAATLTDAEKKMRKPLNASKADMLQAWYTDPKDTPGDWTVQIPGITEDELVDGLTIRVRLSTSYAENGQGYNTLNVNGLGPKLLYSRYNSLLTSHVPQWAEILLTYRTTHSVVSAIDNSINVVNGCRPSDYTPSSGYHINENLGSDGWILDASYSDGNNYERLNNAYERRYANSLFDVFPYTLCMIDENGRLHSIVTSSTAGTSKVADPTPFRPDRIIYYASADATTKDTAIDDNVLYEDIPMTTILYSINSTMTTYSDLYLVGTVNANGQFILDDSSTTSYYKIVDTKTAAIPANTFVKGKYYLYVGASTTSANYMQLLPSHQLFFCNDTNGQKLIAVTSYAVSLVNPKVNMYTPTQLSGTEIGKIILDDIQYNLYYGKPNAFVWTTNDNGQLILNLSFTDSTSIAAPVMPAASTSQNGVLTHTAQTIGGIKTFNDIVKLKANQYTDTAGTGSLDLQNSDIYGVNSIKFANLSNTPAKGLQWYRDSTHVDSLWVNNGVIKFTPNRAYGSTSETTYDVLHTGNLNPVWVEWVIGTVAGPVGKATFGGTTTNAVTLQMTAIPAATTSQSGIITTASQTVANNKFTNGTHIGMVNCGANDQFLDFAHGTDPTGSSAAGASWRIGALNSGSGDAKYFVIQTGGSDTAAVVWNNAVRIGMNTLDIAIGSNLYSYATTNTKTLGTSSYRWKAVYIGTADTHGAPDMPIYWYNGVPTPCSYNLKANVNDSTATYMAYYSTNTAISGTSSARMIDGCLNLYPTNDSYREGMRIHSVNNWSNITLMGADSTATSGTSANSWLIGNNNGNFYIARNGSTSSTTSLFGNVGNVWKLYGNQTNSKNKQQSILHIYGPTYGDTAADMISDTAGLFSFGDGGPQITFSTDATPGEDQTGALIFTDNDAAAIGASFHFVSNQTDWTVTSKRFHANTSIGIRNGAAATATATSTDTTYIAAGAIDLTTSTPYIDFHYNNSTADYTSRIIADTGAGCLHLMYSATPNLTYNSRTRGVNLYNQGVLYSSGAIETGDYFLNNVPAAGGGYYLYGANAEYGHWHIYALGTANSDATQGTLGEVYLDIGNNIARPAAGTAGGANNARGRIRLYDTNANFTQILAQANGDRTFYLPNYAGDMIAVHAGSNAAIGDGDIPVYVAANGRVTACNQNLPVMQYTTWSIASGATSTTISKTQYKTDTYVVSLVVTSGESYLNGPITWNTNTAGSLVISTSAATTGAVSGYVITCRAVAI